MSDSATPPKPKSFESEVRSAQEQALRDNSDVFLLGENVGKMGGIRGASIGFLERFGPDRVVDTTISDSATLGMASGMALAGKKVIVELSGPDRLAATWEVLRLDLANLQSRTNGAFSSTVVLRVPGGKGLGGGRYMEAAPEGNLANIDGLRVLSPSSGTEAGAMLLESLQQSGPTVILEPNALSGQKQKIPVNAPAIQGADILQEGSDITVIAYGCRVQLAIRLAEAGQNDGFSAEVVNLRSLRPLDVDTLSKSVQKTGRFLFLHQSETLASRIVAEITRAAFFHLEAEPLHSMSNDMDELLDCVWATFET